MEDPNFLDYLLVFSGTMNSLCGWYKVGILFPLVCMFHPMLYTPDLGLTKQHSESFEVKLTTLMIT